MIAHIRPLSSASPYGWIFWAAFLFAYIPEFMLIGKSKPATGESADRGSMGLIMFMGWLGFPAAFFVASWANFVLQYHRLTWFALGIVILLAGSLLRRYCFRKLGRYFTGNVRVEVGQPVIQNGLYRWVRHPSYTGGMLLYLGTGLALTNWLSVLILVGMGAVTYAYRVYVEEKALAASLGQPYGDYMERTKRFIPFVL